mgnify:FL=1
MDLNIENIKSWMECTKEKIEANQQYLTKLDQAIGDGDHGVNMTRGFREVLVKINETNYDSVSELMKDIAMTILSKVGGAAGPLYGTAFLKLSLHWQGEKSINCTTFSEGLRKALEEMKRRGRTERGEKTMVDVWEAVVQYVERAEPIETNQLRIVAKEAVEKTKEMIGTKGRAAYFKENTIGHIDPGAMSSYFLFESLCEALEEK